MTDAESAAAATALRQNARWASFASHFLPRDKCDAVAALVAGCRMIRTALPPQPAEGATGGCCSEGEATVLLRRRVNELFENRLELPHPEFRDESQHILAALGDSARRFQVPKSAMTDFIDACVADAATIRYATWNALRRHCDGIGGSLAVMILCVLGASHSDVRRHAVDFGAAGRLISILRRLRSDLAANRVYIPIEDLARSRYSERELLAGLVNDRFRTLIEHETARARGLLESGAQAIRWLEPDGSRAAAALAFAVQAGLLDDIRRAGFNAFALNDRIDPMSTFRRLGRAHQLTRDTVTSS